MQVVHRNGDDRADRPTDVEPGGRMSADGSDARDTDDHISTELALRASELTAVAVAAAAVTSSVATAETPARTIPQSEPADKPVAAVAPSSSTVSSVDNAGRAPELAFAAPLRATPQADNKTNSVRSVKLLASWSSWGVIAAVLWWSSHWQGAERGLEPVLTTMPMWAVPVVAGPPVTPSPAVADIEQETPPDADSIALSQQEAEEKAHALAEKRAAAEARRQKEDAVQALRDKRRQAAQTELAAARANAERAQVVVPVVTPAVVELPIAPALADQVKQCQAQPLQTSETCLHNLCNGKWGKQGCPAYDATYNGA